MRNKNVGLLFALLVMVFAIPAFAQQTKVTKNVVVQEPHYAVSDSVVYVYSSASKVAPYKMYDFATRYAYVYFDGTQNNVVAHAFDTIALEEIAFIRQIGCDNTLISDNFRRFCK
jgi:ATP/ADP translocase